MLLRRISNIAQGLDGEYTHPLPIMCNSAALHCKRISGHAQEQAVVVEIASSCCGHQLFAYDNTASPSCTACADLGHGDQIVAFIIAARLGMLAPGLQDGALILLAQPLHDSRSLHIRTLAHKHLS